MAQPATKRLTFAEFQELNLDGRYELVDGILEELVPPRPFHSWTGARLPLELGRYLDAHEPGAFWGVELDTVTKREEYARAGIQHYWIVDPQRRTVLTLALRGTAYEVAGEFSGTDIITSALFPGLALPLARLFRS